MRTHWWTPILLIALLPGCHGSGPANAPKPTSPVGVPMPVFQEITSTSGVTFSRTNGAFGKRFMPESIGGGGAIIDFDNDGWPDLLLVNGDWWPGHPLGGARPTSRLYRNKRDGTFEDVTRGSGLEAPMQGMGAAVGDFDNDGLDDVYITGVGGTRLYRNQGNGRFADITSSSGIRDSGWSTSAAWLDYDNDGRLDLFVCHYVQWTPAADVYCGTSEKIYCRPQDYPGESCRLFHNLGGGKFQDVTAGSGIQNKNSKALGVTICDIDADGRPDIVVANDMEPNFAYHNDGNGKFTDVALEQGLAVDESGQPRGGMGIDSAFAGPGGALDVSVGNFYSQGVAVFRRQHPPSFIDVSKSSGAYAPTYPFVTFGLFYADMNNDGWPDILLTNGHIYDNVKRMDPSQSWEQPCTLLLNREGAYVDATAAAGPALSLPVVGRGACYADFDNDGRIDVLLIPNSGPVHLLKNTMNPAGNWCGVQLAGTRSNRNGFGATVTLRSGGRMLTRYAHDGSSYLSDSDHRLHLGLGASSAVDSVSRIDVKWPTGLVESWKDVPAGIYTRLVEGTGTPVPAG